MGYKSFFAQGIPQQIWEKSYDFKERIMGYPKLHEVFRKKNRYDLDLRNPQTHNQRITHKKITDRNPLITLTSDKLKVRKYVRNKLGYSNAEEILIPQFFISKTGRDIPTKDWEFEFFLKANHASGFNKLIAPGTDPAEVQQLAVYWLSQSYGQILHEWAYRDIPRRIICEKVLRNENGTIPMDVKLHFFNGKVKMISFLSDRFTDSSVLFTDENFVEIPGAQLRGIKKMGFIPDLPHYDKMKRIGEVFASDFTYCRVDFYSMGSKVYLGELTHYPGSGINRFDDFDTDLALGELWKPENKSLNFFEVLAEVKSGSISFVNNQ